jgi:hypothetical protein
VAGRLLRPTILIHEAFHDLSDFNQDFGGNPAKDQAVKYHQNDTNTQLQNAYAMSQFVLHINEGQEKFSETVIDLHVNGDNRPFLILAQRRRCYTEGYGDQRRRPTGRPGRTRPGVPAAAC